QRDEGVDVGAAALAPVGDVVVLEEAGGGAAGVAAAAVAVLDEASGAVWDDALAAADGDGFGVAPPHWPDGAVAGDLAHQVWGECALLVEPGVAVGVEVDVDAVVLQAGLRLDGVQGAVGDLEEGIGVGGVGVAGV